MDEAALSDLDKVLAEEWETLAKHTAALREALAEGPNRTYELRRLASESKEVRVDFESGQSIVSDSIAKIQREAAIAHETPIALQIRVESGPISARISIDKQYGGGLLRLNVTPEQSHEAREMFVALRTWAMRVKWPWWQNASLITAVWMVWMASLFATAFLISTPEKLARREASKQAVTLLQDGLSADEVTEAVGLILAIETRQVPVPPESEPRTFVAWVLFGGFVACALFSVRPKLELGIAAGVSRLKAWRWWLNFIAVTLPGFAMAVVARPWLIDFFKKF